MMLDILARPVSTGSGTGLVVALVVGLGIAAIIIYLVRGGDDDE